MNLTEACATYLSVIQHTRNLSPLTIKAYKQDLAALLKNVDQTIALESLTRHDIRQIVDALFSKGESRSTVKRRVACYKSMFSWLESEDIIAQTPFHKLNLKLKLPLRLPRNLSSDELKKIRYAALLNVNLQRDIKEKFNSKIKNQITPATTLLGLELLLTTGLRISELTSIRIEDIHLSERYIHIRGKGQRERRVFIVTDNISSLIAKYLVMRSQLVNEHQLLLINKQGNPATSQTFRLWLKALGKQARLSRNATPHMYRHSAATQLLEAGVDIRYVQRLLGHQSITTTQIYTHVNNTELYKHIVEANIQGQVL
jgi:integrase/recombinase XerD